MVLNFYTEARLSVVDDIVYAPQGFSMSLWNRYLSSFDEIRVFSRMQDLDCIPKGHVPVVSPQVSFIRLPYYVGPKGAIINRTKIVSIIKKFICKGEAYLCRVPGNIGTIAADILHRASIPYCLEVVGDPWESMSKSAYDSRLSKAYQIFGRNSLRRITKNCAAALYVTDYYLQQKYPVRNGRFSTSASNVILRDDCYSAYPKVVEGVVSDRKVRFLAVGTLAQLYKAPDIVLKALSVLKKKGYNFNLIWYGDGQYRKDMIELADQLSLSENVSFQGSVLQDVIRDEFVKTDIFVHASRAEGLPRAVIEAMAYGLPCIGSSVAGIPELLSENSIVSPDDIFGLADKMEYFITHPEYMNSEAKKNWEKSKDYHTDILTGRRNCFYKEIIRVSSI